MLRSLSIDDRFDGLVVYTCVRCVPFVLVCSMTKAITVLIRRRCGRIANKTAGLFYRWLTVHTITAVGDDDTSKHMTRERNSHAKPMEFCDVNGFMAAENTPAHIYELMVEWNS